MLCPVPVSGSTVSLHRGGELVLWHTEGRGDMGSLLDEWKAVVGWRKGSGGEGGDAGGAPPLSIITDFPSPKAATAPKHGKKDPTG